MDQQRRQHRCTTAHHLGLCLALALGLTLGTQGATARECARETPLPAEVRLIAPGPEVPEAVARFAGAWVGEWEHADGLCRTLVVELHAELAGHTFYAGPVNIYFARDGVLSGTYKADADLGTQYDVGRLRLTAAGQFCTQWHVSDGRREGCGATVSREGETFVFSPKDRFADGAYRCVPGNSEGS